MNSTAMRKVANAASTLIASSAIVSKSIRGGLSLSVKRGQADLLRQRASYDQCKSFQVPVVPFVSSC